MNILINKFIVCFILILLFISCKNDIEYNFNKLISIKENNNENILLSVDLHGIENVNQYYRNLYNKGKTINEYLLGKIYSEKMTNWYNYPFYLK